MFIIHYCSLLWFGALYHSNLQMLSEFILTFKGIISNYIH